MPGNCGCIDWVEERCGICARTFSRVLAGIDSEELQQGYSDWMASLDSSSVKVLDLDGKVVRNADPAPARLAEAAAAWDTPVDQEKPKPQKALPSVNIETPAQRLIEAPSTSSSSRAINPKQYYRRDHTQRGDHCRVRHPTAAWNPSLMRSLAVFLYERQRGRPGCKRSLPDWQNNNHRHSDFVNGRERPFALLVFELCILGLVA